MGIEKELDREVATAFFGQFKELREIQKFTIEPLLSGRNVILTSGTGSGKTEAVVAPLVSKYWRQSLASNSLFLLYIAPTKALVNDIEKRLYLPLSSLGIRIGIRHGDRDDLVNKRIPNVLITTPESLDVLLFRKDPALNSIQAVVIDEVHLLYNTQRGLQLSILLRRLTKLVPQSIQWAALSATVGDLSYVRTFLFGVGEKADLLSFSTNRNIDAKIRYIENLPALVDLIKKLVEGQNTKLLLFTNSRQECDRLAAILQQDDLLQNIVLTHFSSLSTEVRVDTERKFASLNSAICIATSTLELGIDIGDIHAVLLWGVPGGVDSFLQRIGRSNRRSQKTNVICLIPDNSKNVEIDGIRFAGLIESARMGELPIQKPYDLFGAVGQQCLSVIASEGGRYKRIAELCELVSHKPYLTRSVVEEILSELATNGFLQHHGYKNQYGADESLHNLVDLRLIYGNFGMNSQMVNLFHGAKKIGDIPASNLLRIRESVDIRFAGKFWQVKNISIDGIHLILLKYSSSAMDISYGGGKFPSDPHDADRLWRFLHMEDPDLEVFAKNIRENIRMLINDLKRVCNQDEIPFVRSIDGIRYFTFAGENVNRAIGLFSKKPDFKSHEFSLLVPSPINWNAISTNPLDYEDYFHQLFEPPSNQSIYQQQLPSRLQEQEFLQEWLNDEEIPRVLLRLSKSKPIQITEQSSLETKFT